MIHYKMFLKCGLLFIFLSVFIINVKALGLKSPDNYGPYELSSFESQVCRGPKSTNLTDVSASFTKIDDDYMGEIKLMFFAQVLIEEVKIVYYSMVGNVKQVLWSYNLKNPCEHYLIRKKIEELLKSQNCVIEKGEYLTVTRFKESFQNFLGSSFFYGSYTIKINVVSKKGNILCLVIKTVFEKNNSKSPKT